MPILAGYYCPMGCGKTLTVTPLSGLIVCGVPSCPRSTAVDELLRMRDVVEHRVTFGATGFQVVHPLRERFGDLIARCPLDEHLRHLDGPPVKALGAYLAVQSLAGDGGWVYLPWAAE